jgi:cyclic beta-1,2-glucan synthetase
MPQETNNNRMTDQRVKETTNETRQESLASLGKRIVRPQQLSEHVARDFPLLERFEQQKKALRDSHQKISHSQDPQLAQSHAAEWLLDNFYLVEETFQQIEEDFPESFYRKLPQLTNTAFKAYPRVFALAWSLVQQVGFNPSYDQIERFMDACQEVTALKIGEIWAFPIMLRLAILEALAQEMAAIGEIPLPEFIVHVDLSGGKRRQRAIVAGCIQGLRTVKILNWKDFFEAVSQVENILKRDPSQIYPQMDFDSKDRYRKAVEELALRSDQPESSVASHAVQLAEAASAKSVSADDPAAQLRSHVGFYLVERGISKLREDLGYAPGLGEWVSRWMREHSLLLYVGSILLVTAMFVALMLAYMVFFEVSLVQMLLALVLSLLPAAAAAVSLVNMIVTFAIPPRTPLARLDFSKGVPEKFRTLVVIPALLTSVEEIRALLHQIELYYLANADDQVFFALLTDFQDADSKHKPEDEDLLEEVTSGIKMLNERYPKSLGSNFYLFHRDREWNPAEDTWMGWERKRGKLSELNRFLRGDNRQAFSRIAGGDIRPLSGVKYVVTMDEDTLLPNNTARELIGVMAHPFNRPRIDPQSGEVVAGYTFLQPRVEVKPGSALLTWFTRIYVGDGGIDLYSQVISNVYQDLFAEGSYMGKGIYDVDAYLNSLEGKIPENSVLSHDLLEGLHGRAGLVTDVVLYESYPPFYLAYAQRIHRWVRGDWQLLPWLLPFLRDKTKQVSYKSLSALGYWKLFDNLRRSLTFPGTLAFLIFGWLWSPGSVILWTLAALLPLALPVFSGVIPVIWSGLRSLTPVNRWRSLRYDLARWFMMIVFLPYQSFLIVDAIAATLVRLFITQKHLLQWTTAAHTIQVLNREFQVQISWNRMRSAAIFALVIGALVGLVQPGNLVIVAPILVAGLVSPQIAYWISQPIVHKPDDITAEQRQELRRLARRTWLFFEQFVGPEDHWLPPDHFQEEPRGTVAHRTSPTNIGLGLLSILGAYDLGYIGLPELIIRLQNSLDEINSLEKFNGHLLNWYQTQNLKPLLPRYVSTVDSGNFAGSLLALQQGCREVTSQPTFSPQRWQGLLDTLDVLIATLQKTGHESQIETLLNLVENIQQEILAAKNKPGLWLDALNTIENHHWAELDQQMRSFINKNTSGLEANTLHGIRIWTERVHQHLAGMFRTSKDFLPWWAAFDQHPQIFDDGERLDAQVRSSWRSLQDTFPTNAALEDIEALCKQGIKKLGEFQDELAGAGFTDHVQEVEDWCQQFSDSLSSTQKKVNELLQNCQKIWALSEKLFQEMDFSFLYNERRNLFRIGYNIDSGRLDDNHYDLLASEARLASFISIAKGDVPQKHWLYLGRPITKTRKGMALISWSGSMFEYLMPHLLMKRYPGTLLDMACTTVIEKQIDYGKSHQIPWGISESGYYHFDANMNYQYRAFGVPSLGLKRGLDVDLVITPYASVLAIDVNSKEVVENITRLANLDMLGMYGFYEAVDYTDARLPLKKDHAFVRSFMSHHQGMILISLTNFLENESMIRRFHADPRIDAFNLLLQEQIPPQPHFQIIEEEEITRIQRTRAVPSEGSWHPKTNLGFPSVHFLSNGSFGSLITHNGSGFLQYRPYKARRADPIMLTRWRPDTTLDRWGTWTYIGDVERGHYWSAGIQPTGVMPDMQNIQYFPHQVELNRRDGDISTQTLVSVSPEEDVEIRKISLVNHQNEHRQLRITSYGEVVLADQSTDARHQAFNKLFVEAEYHPELRAILFRRRPRSADEESTFLVHMLSTKNSPEVSPKFECDRAEFIGRGRTAKDPQILGNRERQLTNTDGTTLDPIMSLSLELDLPPRQRQELAFVTLAAGSRQKALSLAKAYQAWSRIERTFQSAASANSKELSNLDLSVEDLQVVQQLLSVLYYSHPALRADPQTLASNEKGQSGLWAFAISGDYPILLVRTYQTEDASLVEILIKAHSYWRKRGIKIDLVILDHSDISYDQDLQGEIRQLVTQMDSDRWINQRGGIFILRAGQMKSKEVILLETAAKVVLDGRSGSFEEQVTSISKVAASLPELIPLSDSGPQNLPGEPVAPPNDLLFDNGYGGFCPDGGEYVLFLEPGKWTPSPWINVISNPQFGFIASESGLGSTWYLNSGENRLTPWRNDPVSDIPAEAVYLRNEDTGQISSPTPLPVRDSMPHVIRHGAGYSIFEHNIPGLAQEMCTFVDPDDPVKVVRLKLKNTLDRVQQYTVTYFAEWVLGPDREPMAPFIIPEYSTEKNALLARNEYNQEFHEHHAFLSANRELHGCTTDRAEFLGINGSYSHPDGLKRVGLSGAVSPGQDPCAAFQVLVWLEPGETKEVAFLFGEGSSRTEAMQLIEKYQQADEVEQSWRRVQNSWKKILTNIQVHTPDPAVDLMLNQWLLYQAISCRLWGRSALYQSSGSYGFRDQLQDVMALVNHKPELTREHILDAARHQFTEGDVLHWWHPPTGRGLRTRCSDNMLWLPYVTAYYVKSTADDSILQEELPYLSAKPLQEDEHERYGNFEHAGEEGTLLEHCQRAIAFGSTQGVHGLPLIGSHDWNDGMNRIGLQGKGESVWLGWFLYATLHEFSDVCENIGEKDQAQRYRQQAQILGQSLENNAWDGAWYRRAYFDDGTPLGSSKNEECQIDSLAQSWAVLSGAADPDRAQQAMEAVEELLVDWDDALIKLFTPPFDESQLDPGYIKGYPPGIRENGGQYTHAAIWAVWAYSVLGQSSLAGDLFRMLNPIYHSDSNEKADLYQVEPYVIAADIYSVAPHTGKGGWTWYTGSGGWTYRLGLEAILGFQRAGDRLKIDPCIPRDWREYAIHYKHGEADYHIQVINPKQVNRGVEEVHLDGETLPDKVIPLVDDGKNHQAVIKMG